MEVMRASRDSETETALVWTRRKEAESSQKGENVYPKSVPIDETLYPKSVPETPTDTP